MITPSARVTSKPTSPRTRIVFRLLLLWLCLFCALGLNLAAPDLSVAQAQQPKPFSLPFNLPPGPTTWLLSQQYGSTIGAFNYGRYWYAAGQDLHFGLDFWAPCNTPVVAIADGEVDQVDNMSFGLDPHNLTIFHRELRFTSVYGHLNAKPTLMKGQPVKRGDVIGVSGDPDRTCVSRPHLHLEIRNSSYSTAYNPMLLIDADWNALATIGYHRFGGFVKDLVYPNRWQTFFDQPDVAFNQDVLNNFTYSWPPPERNAPPPETRAGFVAPLPTDLAPTLGRITQPGCCSLPWWSPDGQFVRFWDGPPGRVAPVVQVRGDVPSGEPETPQQFSDGLPRIYSPDASLYLSFIQSTMTIVGTADNKLTPIATGGAWPRFSPNGQKILWHRRPADDIPGGTPPLSEIWVANADGSGRLLIATQSGGSVFWLDDDRILIVQPVGRTNESDLSVYTISKRQKEPLTRLKNLRGLSVAPGGLVILFYLPFQDDLAASGIYGMVAQPGSKPIRLPFFGSYRWRDSNSILYLRYANGGRMAIANYDITTGQDRLLTDLNAHPISVLNDDWSVSPDGRRILFWNAIDTALYVLRLW